MGYTEFTDKNVNAAIMKASIELSTSSEDLDIKIISEGNSGFFGFGSKPAIIRVCKKSELQPVAEEVVKDKKEHKQEQEVQVEVKKTTIESVINANSSTDDVKNITKKFLNEVFQAMNIEVEMIMEYNADDKALDVEFVGQDMGILIGKRGQTLDSLQYLTNLVVNKEKQEYVRVKLDTENYRKRRKETLENLARNISYKVKKTRRPVALEPMNPYERRIIHSALQGNKFVETYSEGNEPYRHVVITLKK